MPRSRKPKKIKKSTDDKLKEAIESLKNIGFRSTNDFVFAYYDSVLGIQSLRAQEDKSYGPTKILDTWTRNVPKGSEDTLNMVIINKASEILVKEARKASREPSLHLTSSGDGIIDMGYLTSEFGLEGIKKCYLDILPCLCTLLYTLLTAPNDYETWKHTEKLGKSNAAYKVLVVVISIILFFRNRATNAFQFAMGLYLASSGASRRLIDNFNHMGLSTSYQSVQRSLQLLTRHATQQARDFATKSGRLWAIVYDNINFTLHKASQRLDSTTQQLNATTLALFSLPRRFVSKAYDSALHLLPWKKLMGPGSRQEMTYNDIALSEGKHEQAAAAFKHVIRTILLTYIPGNMQKRRKTKHLRKHVLSNKPKIRVLEHEKTQFFALPAINEEEASIPGTIRVVQSIFTKLLAMSEDIIPTKLRLLVGDWLSIRNLRLMKDERAEEFRSYLRMDWVQEASMPFHFQLNAMYALCRTHMGNIKQENPSSLEHHRSLLRRAKLDPKKPEYNKAKELVFHSLIARILDCARIVLEENSVDELQNWSPTIDEFETVTNKILIRFTTTKAAHNALYSGDEVLAHSILFIRDSLFFWEFCDAIRDADVGRMWLVYDFWLYMMRGAGCHNYGNEILEMKAQFTYEFPPLLRDIVERCWLVNRWGKRGRSIPTDLYLEHNNGFIKNMFAAMGSCASMEHIQEKSSACVELLRNIAHDMSVWIGSRDFNRHHTEVSIRADILALCLDLAVQGVHTVSQRKIPFLPSSTQKKGQKNKKSAVKDVLHEGRIKLVEQGMFDSWKKRTLMFEDEGLEREDDDAAFGDPNGRLIVDVAMDPDFVECPFSNVDIVNNCGEH